ncbi:xylose isomerase [Hydrogenophaga sp. SL48]|uniref:xylose isomerase n=1 Tax=Hydrogenophaga sp. SL48 TaxID=2806347 RepID=UPI003019D821
MNVVRPPLPIGINLDGVLVHDGRPTPDTPTRLRWVREAGVFDYIEKNIDPREDFAPYRDWVAEHGVPIGVFGGIFCAGRDEALMHWGLRIGGELGARLFNMQLFARHADGHELNDREVADWFLDAMEHGSAIGCLPSVEVHVDMWNERFHRVEAVGELLARANVPLRLTLDHSHLVFKIGNDEELAASGLQGSADGGRSRLAPSQANSFYRQWLARGWVVHAHTRSVAPGVPGNAAMQRADGRPGRAIQYPFTEPAPGSFHLDWDAQALTTWKDAVLELLAEMKAHPERTPQQISCEFIPFPDYGGGGRYDIWQNNIACARWLQEKWRCR